MKCMLTLCTQVFAALRESLRTTKVENIKAADLNYIYNMIQTL
jgi:hypothetical protein